MNTICEKSIIFLKNNSNFDPAHDINHLIRVQNLAIYITRKEKLVVDKKLVILFALFHDFLDYKLVQTENISNKKEKMLFFFKEEINLNEIDIKILLNLIVNEGDKNLRNINDNIIHKIVKDADIIDSFGSIGIARVFSYGGKIGRKIQHDKSLENGISTEYYIQRNLIKKYQNLNFDISKELAKPKINYIKKFLNNLKKEILFYDELFNNNSFD